MSHRALSHSTFFEHMEEFGYLRDIDEHLPPEFTAVFEIARVLEDPDSELALRLKPAMNVSTSATEEAVPRSYDWLPNRFVTHGEEFEAALMRNFDDLKRILPHQYLLPEEVFMRRLSQRSLWINIPVNPVIVPFGTSGSEYAPDIFKQKVYLLLDTSTSMTSHHRFQMAKAVVYVFLKRNLRELGHVFLRTFDVDLGPLQTATDEASLRRLIHYTMRLTRMGNGTAMQRAILQAAEDIRNVSSLSGAEILMVTDGASHLDNDAIRLALGDNIRINTVKIGNAEIFADERLLAEIASRGSSPESKTLAAMEEEMRRLKRKIELTGRDASSGHLRLQMSGLVERTNRLRAELVARIGAVYGREIEQLSNVFIHVDDISADAIFTLRESEIDEIRELLMEVESDFREGIDADTLREAALLLEHVQMLLDQGGDAEQLRRLEEVKNRLEQLLNDVSGEQTIRGKVPSTQSVSSTDRHDLKMMMRGGQMQRASVLRALVRLIRETIRRLRSGVRRLRRSRPRNPKRDTGE